MKNEKKVKTGNTKDILFKEYEKLMKSSNDSFIVPVQWTNEGDTIERFSLYENYTPVKTSGDTSPNLQ
jgi:hypothetical protein